jgi:hypothetical protein
MHVGIGAWVLPCRRWSIHPLMEELKAEAQTSGLWNLWMPADTAELVAARNPSFPRRLLGAGLSNLEYSHLSRVMGASPWASEVFNCSAPDTGNMETLARWGVALTLSILIRLYFLLKFDCVVEPATYLRRMTAFPPGGVGMARRSSRNSGWCHC